MEWLLKEVSFKWISSTDSNTSIIYYAYWLSDWMVKKGLIQRLYNGLIDWVHEWITG